MGKINFRRIGGRIVPIFSSGNVSKVLPAPVGKRIEEVREIRGLRKLEPTDRTPFGKALTSHEYHFVKREGKIAGSHVASIARKFKIRK